MLRQVSVRYFAQLREQAGREEERLATPAATPRALYEELCRRYAFTLGPSELKVAINDEFARWDSTLADGDSVVFIPPVAGG